MVTGLKVPEPTQQLNAAMGANNNIRDTGHLSRGKANLQPTLEQNSRRTFTQRVSDKGDGGLTLPPPKKLIKRGRFIRAPRR